MRELAASASLLEGAQELRADIRTFELRPDFAEVPRDARDAAFERCTSFRNVRLCEQGLEEIAVGVQPIHDKIPGRARQE